MFERSHYIEPVYIAFYMFIIDITGINKVEISTIYENYMHEIRNLLTPFIPFRLI